MKVYSPLFIYFLQNRQTLSEIFFFFWKKCPFEAIQIINLPKDLEKDTTHRYRSNAFKLHRLPVPRPGQVLGLVGTNGIGKSTALKILAGKLKPNLGRFDVSTKQASLSSILKFCIFDKLNVFFKNYYSFVSESSGLARNFGPLPRVRTSKLFHPSCRRKSKGS